MTLTSNCFLATVIQKSFGVTSFSYRKLLNALLQSLSFNSVKYKSIFSEGIVVSLQRFMKAKGKLAFFFTSSPFSSNSFFSSSRLIQVFDPQRAEALYIWSCLHLLRTNRTLNKCFCVLILRQLHSVAQAGLEICSPSWTHSGIPASVLHIQLYICMLSGERLWPVGGRLLARSGHQKELI